MMKDRNSQNKTQLYCKNSRRFYRRRHRLAQVLSFRSSSSLTAQVRILSLGFRARTESLHFTSVNWC